MAALKANCAWCLKCIERTPVYVIRRPDAFVCCPACKDNEQAFRSNYSDRALAHMYTDHQLALMYTMPEVYRRELHKPRK